MRFCVRTILTAYLTVCLGTASYAINCPGLVADKSGSARNDDASVEQVKNAISSFGDQLGELNEDRPIRVLLISTGGVWAAYGAGFLTGWSSNTKSIRPEFDIVAGASAGSTLSPFALVGRSADKKLPFQLDDDGNFIEKTDGYTSFAAGVNTDSLFRARGLEEVAKRKSSEIFAELKESSEKKILLMGAVNLDTGQFDVFDVSGYLNRGGNDPNCVAMASLASSAVPGILPTREINQNRYTDAGVRDHLVVQGFEEVLATIQPERSVEVTVLVNSSLTLGDFDASSEESSALANALRQVITDARRDREIGTLYDVAKRSIGIVGDQLLRNSIQQTAELALQNDWVLKVHIPANVNQFADCDGSDILSIKTAPFASCVAESLFHAGRLDGENMEETSWLDSRETIQRMKDY